MAATKERKVREPSSGERTFETYWGMFGDESLPYEREVVFHPTRGWAFDFAWGVHKVAVEVEGGAFSGGRHTRGAGFTEDCEKYNAAALYGWRLLRFTPQMLEADPQTCIEQVITLLGGRRAKGRVERASDLCTCRNFKGNGLSCEVCGGFLF